MPTAKNWTVAAFLVVIVVCALVFGPSAYQKMRANSLVEFAQGGVEVRVGGRLTGSGNPILVPGGIGLLLGNEFEFKNARGETRRVVLCNGHPDYWRLLRVALPPKENGFGLKKVVLQMEDGGALTDPHGSGGWWINHFGPERYIRAKEWNPPTPLRVKG